MRTNRMPEAKPRPAFRILTKAAQTHGLGAGTVTANTAIQWALIPVFGSSTISARIKTATNGGTIDLVPVGPDFNVDQDPATAYASLTGTLYTSGGPTQVAVAAGTEALITMTLHGENYVLVKFTGTVGAGSITYCDICQQPVAGR